MKKLLLPLLAAPLACAGPEDFTNFVRQTDYDSFVKWDTPVDAEGEMISEGSVSDIGALFELVTVNNTTGEEIQLDREFVASYAPKVTMEFITGDPYEHAARTRVDQPVKMVVSIDPGESVNGSLDAAYGSLVISHRGYLYPEGVLSPYELGDEPTAFENQYDLEAGNEVVVEFPTATLSATNLTDTEGIEMFSIQPAQTNNGHGNNLDDADVSNRGKKTIVDESGLVDDETRNGGAYIIASTLDTAMLQVWPVASAAISGLDSSTVYKSIPTFSVDLVDLYPDSSTYLRIYQGEPTSNPANPTEIGTSAVVINDTIPQDRRMLINELDEFMGASGSYTIEVLHDTPFGTDVLTQFYPVRVDLTMQVRGTLYSQE